MQEITLAKLALSLLMRRPKTIAYHLKKHFGRNPQKYPVLRAEFAEYRHPCVYQALQQYVSVNQCRTKVVGMTTTDPDTQLSEFVHPDGDDQQTEGPVQYADVVVSNGETLACARRAIYLVRDNGRRFAVYLNCPRREDHIVVEVMAKDRRIAECFLAELRTLADQQSIYKGHVITMKENSHRDMVVRFHTVPMINRNQVILPQRVLEEVERHTTRFSEHSKLLLSRGRHLKRGLLLYGPPGTGKSLTIMHLISAMAGRTTVLLTGTSVSHLEDACALARALQPATVVIEDVDLVAERRTRHSGNAILFELLNQMDGVADDADVLFILSTNCPEVLEPALASRPGRVDQAVMIPLPDADCRHRLFELYGKGLPMAVVNTEDLIDKTEGVSAAYIRELFRKAALSAAEEGPDVFVQDHHLLTALELLRNADNLTGKLLGFDSCVVMI